MQGSSGWGIHENFMFKYTHVFIPHKTLIIAIFFGSLNHRVKENINILPHKISKERFKSACPKLQTCVNKAKATGRNEEAGGVAKRSRVERGCTASMG